LKGVIRGAGAPNYLSDAADVFVRNNYVYVVSSDDSALSIFEISEEKTDNTPAETISTPDTTQTGNDNASILRQWLRIHNPYSI